MYIGRRLALGFAFIISFLFIEILIGIPNNQNHAIYTGVIIVASIIASHFLSSSIVNPIHKLHKGTEIIIQGNFEHKVGTDAKDEIGQLSRAFDTMTDTIIRGTIFIKRLEDEITERKIIEKEVKRSAFYLDAMSDILIVITKEANIVRVNKSFIDLWGYRPEEVYGKSVLAMFTKEEIPKQLKEMKEAMKTGRVREFNTVALTKDGKKIPLHLSGVTMKDENGNLEGFIGTFRDITEQKKMAEERSRLLHKYSERIKELNCIYGLSELVDKSESLEEIFRGLTDLLLPAWQYPEITCAKIIVDGQIFQNENFKETRWKQSAKIKVHGINVGSVEVYYLEERPKAQEGPFLKEERDLINAITERIGKIIERKRINKKIKMLSDVVHQTSDAIAVSDFEGRLVFANEAWAEMHGYEKKELSEADISIFYKKPEIVKLFEDKAKLEGHTRGRIAHLKKDGRSFAALGSFILLKDENGNPSGIVRIAKDIRKIVSDIRDVGVLPKE